MAQFHHHPDGLTYVRVVDHTYCDTNQNFARDFGEASVLPPGIVERFYDDAKSGGTHHLFDTAYNQVAGGERPYRFGDLAIASIHNLLANQAKRIAAAKETSKLPVTTPPSRNRSQIPVVRP